MINNPFKEAQNAINPKLEQNLANEAKRSGMSALYASRLTKHLKAL